MTMYGDSDSPQASADANEQQAAAAAPSVWTPDGAAEPTEAAAAETAAAATDECAASAAPSETPDSSKPPRNAQQQTQQAAAEADRQRNGHDDKAGQLSYFVGGLHPEVTREELEEYLSAYAPVVEIDIKMDAATGRNRGYAFISVRGPFDSEAFLNTAHTIRDKQVDIRELNSKPSAERQPEKPPERRMSSSTANRHKIFIGGITPSITDEILYQHFEQFGSIEKANVIRDATGKSRGFGFVQFTSMDSVAVAVEASPHQLDPDNRVDAQPAQDRGARRPAGHYPSPYYDQSYYGYGYGGAAAGPYGYHHAAAAAYSPVYTPNPYGAYGGGYGGNAFYGGYHDAYGTASTDNASAGYGAVRRGESTYPSGSSSRAARNAPY